MKELTLTQHRQPPSPYGPNYAVLKMDDEDSETLQSWSKLPLESQRRDDNTRSRFGVTNVRGYLQILAPFLLAVLVACMNHVVFSYFDKKEPGTHTSQFWVSVLKNAFPAAVALLLFIGLKFCLLQVALYRMRLDSHPLNLINLITSPPSFINTLSILARSSMRVSMISFAVLAAVTQAIALTSLFVPGTLTVVPAPSRSQMLEVPTIDFNVVDPAQSSFFAFSSGDSFEIPSQRWRQLIQRAASSNTAPTWEPPIGCGSSCTYRFSYAAPALNCTELSRDEIWANATNPTVDSLLVFGPQRYYFYNASVYYLESNQDYFTVGLDVIYMENFNSTNSTMKLLLGNAIDQQQWSPRGARCAFENATYEATTSFSNNSQATNIRVKDWHGILHNTFPDTNNTNIAFAETCILQSFRVILEGDASFIPYPPNINTTNTASLYGTSLFSMTGHPAAGSESSYFNFLLAPELGGDLSAALQGLLGNVTLAFVNEQMASTTVEADVTPESTQYQYIGWKLGLIYAIVFGSSLVVVAFGLFSLWRNGITAVFDLQHVVEMTAASARLHDLASQPDFGCTLVKGVFSSELDGTLRRRPMLDVSSSKF